MPSVEELAKVAFDAYSKAVGGRNVQGLPIPEWEEVGPKVQDGWKAAVIESIKKYSLADEEWKDIVMKAAREYKKDSS
jgi:hypothetical protein